MRLSYLLFATSWLLSCAMVHAQPSQATKDVWQLVPPDGVALITLQVKAIVEDEANRMMPWEVMTAAVKQQIGVDPLTLNRIDLIACAPGVTIRMGAMLTFEEDLPDDFFQKFQMQDVQANKGVELYAIPGNMDVVLHRKDARHVLIGTKPFVLASVKTKPGDGPLRSLATGLGEPGQISAIVAVEPVREVANSFLQSPPIPPPLLADVQTLVNKSDMLAMRINFGVQSTMATMIQTKAPADATAVSAAMSRLVKIGVQGMMAQAQQQSASAEGRLPKAVVSYMQRLAPEIEKSTTFKANGNRATLILEGPQLLAAQMGVAVGLLLPAVQSARNAARLAQSANNMKQLVLSILNHEAATKRLPGDKDRVLDMKSQYKMEPNLSWRVHILPYLEQQQLYSEFHLDEPWDSPHNIKLLDRMPPFFRHPSSSAKPGYTVYQQPTGEGLAQDPKSLRKIADFTDGTANTICIVETTDQAAVPWTKPGDVNPLTNPEVLRIEAGAFHVVMVNGAFRAISANIDPDMLKAMFTISGGETVAAP